MQVAAGLIVTGLLLGVVELVCAFILRSDRNPQQPRAFQLAEGDAVSSTIAWLEINPVPLVKDIDLLWRNQPLVTRTQLVNPRVYGHDDTWTIKINSEGFRGPERLFPGQTKGVYRILCIGDSVTFGFNTDQGAAFPNQLENWLRAHYPEQRFEVIDAGVPGWSWVQGQRFLELEGLALRPNLVIIAHGSNDQFFLAKITDNERLKRLESRVARAVESVNDLLLHTNTYRAVLKLGSPPAQSETSPECQRQIREKGACRRVTVGEIGSAVHQIHSSTSSAGVDLLVLNLDFMETPAVAGSQYAAEQGRIPFLDMVAKFKELRQTDEALRTQRLGLQAAQEMTPASPATQHGQIEDEKHVLFRVLVEHPGLAMTLRGEIFPNSKAPDQDFRFDVPLYDDGTHGDEVAGDYVFSASLIVPATVSTLRYQYFQDGVPELESLPYPPSAQGYRLIHFAHDSIRPVEVFAEMFLMAERTHPNARGHESIANGIAELLPSFSSFQQFVSPPPPK